MKIIVSDAARGAPSPEHEVVPDGRAIKDIESHILNRLVRSLDIPVAPTAGRATTVQAYVEHLQSMYDAAGKAAVAQWLASKRGAST